MENEHKKLVGKNDPINNKIKISILFLLIIILAVIYLIVHLVLNASASKKVVVNKNTYVLTQCQQPILDQAVSNFKPFNISQLNIVIGSVKKISNYQNDPNCLYVLTTAYIYTSDSINAQNYLNKFNTVYNVNHPLYPKLIAFATVNTMRNNVATLVTQSKQLNQSQVTAPKFKDSTKKQ